jgi:ASCH domain
MKALSIKQPYAAAILAGLKTVEYRSWQTDHRGPLLIHASQGLAVDTGFESSLDVKKLPRGCLVGIVDLVDVDRQETDCEVGVLVEYHWHVANPRAFDTLIPLKGRLNLFEVAEDLLPAFLRVPVNPTAR